MTSLHVQSEPAQAKQLEEQAEQNRVPFLKTNIFKYCAPFCNKVFKTHLQ